MLGLLLAPALALASVTTVTMTSANIFTPASIGIYQGDTVTWVNQGNAVNTVTSDSGAFNSGPIQPGQQFSATFNQSGVYPYHSTNTSSMTGSITVNATGSGTYTNPNTGYYTTTSATTPATANSGTSAALYAQVQSLLSQIQALQAAQGAGVSTGSSGTMPVLNTSSSAYDSSSCPNIGRSLKKGSSGDDVSRLQQFLARESAIYPEGTVSGYYGSLTQTAVQRWQTKYHVVSSGTPDVTGYGVVGPRTAAAIALLCTTGSVNGVSSGATPAVGGFIQVTPVSGTAPLTVNVTATVNTGGSCGGTTYTLDFGDGTSAQQIPVSSGTCSQQSQTYQHTYTYGGTYQVALSAAGHQTTASVTVSGPAAPTTGSTTGSGITTESPSVARGTMSAFSSSGNAPFTVTFYVSCASGVKYNLIFGDGTDLGGSAVSGTTCKNGALDSITHTYTAVGSYTAQLVIFSLQSNGTIAPNNIANVGVTVTSVASNYAYNPPQLSTGSAQYSFNIQFDLPTSCTGYDLSWGDGSAHVIQNDRGTSCAQTSTTVTQSHTYATPTSSTSQYTITLKRGASLAQSDTIGVTVTQ